MEQTLSDQDYLSKWLQIENLPLTDSGEDVESLWGPYALTKNSKLYNFSQAQEPNLFGSQPPFLKLKRELKDKFIVLSIEDYGKLKNEQETMIHPCRPFHKECNLSNDKIIELEPWIGTEKNINWHREARAYIAQIHKDFFLLVNTNKYPQFHEQKLTNKYAGIIAFYFEGNLFQKPLYTEELKRNIFIYIKQHHTKELILDGRFITLQGDLRNNLRKNAIIADFDKKINLTILSLPLCLTKNEVYDSLVRIQKSL